MAVFLSPVYGVAGQLFNNNGDPLAGGKIYTYSAGTTTPAATYTSSSGATAHSNPIVLDGAARVPSGEIWLTDGIAYKFVVEDSANNLIGTYDNLTGINSNFVAFTNEQEIQTATAGQTVFNLTTMQYQPGTNSLSVFVDGVNQYGPGAQYAYVETDSDTVTFVSGLHVGASVKFTTSQLNTSGAIDASQVTYDPPFTGSVITNVEDKLAQTVSVKDFGAVGDGVTDDKAAIQEAMDWVSTSKQALFFPSGTYLISDSLEHITPNELYQNNPNNGIQMFGEEGSIIKASASFPSSNAMLNLDGNPANSETVVAYAQQYNNISNLKFDGNGAADRGIRLRANIYGKFSNLELYNFEGNGLGVIHIRGATTPTKDDADTTFICEFNAIKITGSASGFGFLGTDNRSSQLTFINCDIRDCYSDAVRLSCAGSQFYGCCFAGNGNAAQNTTGGLSIVKSQTQARNRGVTISGCEFENNYWHEINIDYCFGFTIEGCFGSPYTALGRTGQSWFRIGNEAAEGGFIAGNSTMDYTDYGFDIYLYDILAGAKNIAIWNPVIQNPRAGDFRINAAAEAISLDGVAISIEASKPSFMTQTNTSVSNIPNVTGDGTEFVCSGATGFFQQSTPNVNFNNGGYLNAASDGTGGFFTAPQTGFYQFGIQWPITGFDASMNNVQVALLKNYGGVGPTRFIVCNQKISSYSPTDVAVFGGTLQVKLVKGDTITASVIVSGGAKVADIKRDTPSQFIWWGTAI